MAAAGVCGPVTVVCREPALFSGWIEFADAAALPRRNSFCESQDAGVPETVMGRSVAIITFYVKF